MYFHLIWIKEKSWNKYDLNLLLSWWDEDFIRKFLTDRWVVIVSINEYKEDPKDFWNIILNLTYDSSNIQMIMQWEDLSESIVFIVSLWLKPSSANFIDNPIADNQMIDMINSATLTVEEEDKKAKQQEELEEFQEKKKYEEKWIEDWLKILNSNIDRMEQVLKIGIWILSSSEIKQLEDYSSEMKKIRLWTNFNKMASLVLESHALLKQAEEQIFDADADKKFLIDKNSSVTNIDALKSYFDYSRIAEKARFQPELLTTTENVISIIWIRSVLLKLLGQDISHSFDNFSLDDFFSITVNLLEFIVISIIIVISCSWLISPLIWIGEFSLYLLPAMWWLWLLLYLLNNLKLKWIMLNLVWFVILVIVYWWWLNLLLNTFAL